MVLSSAKMLRPAFPIKNPVPAACVPVTKKSLAVTHIEQDIFQTRKLLCQGVLNRHDLERRLDKLQNKVSLLLKSH